MNDNESSCAAALTDGEILAVATNLFPMWREDIQPQFVLRVVRAAFEADAARSALAVQPEPQASEPAPYELDYLKAIEHCRKTLGYRQGTGGCIAFARGVEWGIAQIREHNQRNAK